MKVTERGQITIPKVLRDRFGLYRDVEVELVLTKDGILIQKGSRSRHPVDLVYGILNRPSDTDTYIEEIRGRCLLPLTLIFCLTFSSQTKDLLQSQRNFSNWHIIKGH